MPGVTGKHSWCLICAELECRRVAADEEPQVRGDEHRIVTLTTLTVGYSP
jgi:hypothetical protein